MNTTLNALPLASYPLLGGMDAHNLTVAIDNLPKQNIQPFPPLPFPEEATKEQVLDAIVLLEPHLKSPAVNALCAVALSWYLDTLSQGEAANLSERVQLLIRHTAHHYPYAFARA